MLGVVGNCFSIHTGCFRRLERLPKNCDIRDVSISNVAVRVILDRPTVAGVIIGTWTTDGAALNEGNMGATEHRAAIGECNAAACVRFCFGEVEKVLDPVNHPERGKIMPFESGVVGIDAVQSQSRDGDVEKLDGTKYTIGDARDVP